MTHQVVPPRERDIAPVNDVAFGDYPSDAYECTRSEPVIFHPQSLFEYRAAIKVCDDCSIQSICQEYGQQNRESGVWGGLLIRNGRRIRPAFESHEYGNDLNIEPLSA